MADIAIVGPGAVGGVIAASLALLGRHSLTLCARSAIDGLAVDLTTGPVRVSATVLTDPAVARPVDWVLADRPRAR